MKRGKYGKYIWEKKDLEFLKANWPAMTNKELSEALGITLTKCREKLYELGLKRMELEYWTDDQTQFLLENYESIGDAELADIFNDLWEKRKGWTKKHIEKKRRYLKLKRTREQIKAIHSRNVKAGRFAICPIKAWAVRGVTEVGNIRLWNHSYGDGKFAVIKTENGFVHYNRWLWIEHFGELDSDQLVVTKSGKTIAKGPDDLELIDRSEHARRNSLKRYPEELRTTVKTLRKLKRELSY